MNNLKTHLLVLILFIGLTILMTYPIAFNINSAVRDTADPLLNTWILSWNVRQITSGDFWNLFNANIFYPHERTLAYSEHLFSQSLVALPVMLLSKNPILAYNFVFLLSFVTSGFGMYLLVSYLTRNTFAGIIAGIIFAFSPFMFAQLSHLQSITAGGIPLAFLFLHKFFNGEKYKHLLLFTLFYLLQVLANGYYAMYLTLFAGFYILYYIISRRRYGDWQFWAKTGLFVLIVIVVAGPFFYQYLAVRWEMGFVRRIELYADITSYLSTFPINRLYGKLTAPFYKPEGELFPGIVPVLLIVIGLIYSVKNNLKVEPVQKRTNVKFTISFQRLIDILILFWGILIVIILVTGGFEYSVRISATRLKKPILTIMLLLCIRIFVSRRFRKALIRSIASAEEHIWIYLAIFTLAFLFTFGPNGPYIFLYKYIPGFDGLRVASRFHIFVMFSIAVFAAFGVRTLLPRLSGIKQYLTIILLPLLILIEYLSIPIPLSAVPVKENIPEVYKWLAKQEGDFAIIEYPLPKVEELWRESQRLYYSTYHWKKLVNGWSGYLSPIYGALRGRQEEFPSKSTIEDLASIGVKFIISHSGSYKKDTDGLRFIGRFGEAYVHELKEWETDKQSVASNNTYVLPRTGWEVESNYHPELAGKAIDGNYSTRWHSGQPQRGGIYFRIDLKGIYNVSGISLYLGSSPADYPRGYKVEVSDDKKEWFLVAKEEEYRLPLHSLLKPLKLKVDITFNKGIPAQYIKVTQTGVDRVYWWSIYEMDVMTTEETTNYRL